MNIFLTCKYLPFRWGGGGAGDWHLEQKRRREREIIYIHYTVAEYLMKDDLLEIDCCSFLSTYLLDTLYSCMEKEAILTLYIFYFLFLYQC